MTQTTHPSKEMVRSYLDHRMHQRVEPPPAMEEIRRQLGWHLLPEPKRPDYCAEECDANDPPA
ncbi:hypothetical protein GEV02_12720 [Rugamonas sp. FT29W]|uniref:Uncharacterized protein n=1 Tax=Rugamonas aquatica TaxID=2743357 RepID=A0A6A7N265_9BURK|nr:hypothetical protein [Rugamonas aquatica]